MVWKHGQEIRTVYSRRHQRQGMCVRLRKGGVNRTHWLLVVVVINLSEYGMLNLGKCCACQLLRVVLIRALSSFCIHVLEGHTSTIRCIKVLTNRPIAVSGSRDSTLRVWDVQRGRLLRVLEGHQQSVRCLDVHESKVVSGSYDYTCRVRLPFRFISIFH
jgi:WD40 repeat protein